MNRQTILLIGLMAGMFAIGCDNFLLAGLLPGIGSQLGSSFAAVGQGITVFDLTYVLAAPLFTLVTTKKSVRALLLTGLALFALGNVCTLLSHNLTVFLASRAVVGVGAGIFLPLAVATATGSVSRAARGRALSLVWGSNSAGALIGVPTGLWLAKGGGWQRAIALIVVFCGFAIFALATGKTPERITEKEPSLKERVRLLSDRRVLPIVGVTFLTATASLGLYTYVALLPSSGSALAFTIWNLGGFVGSLAIGYIVDYFGHPRTIMAALIALLMATFWLLPSVHAHAFFGLPLFFLWGAVGWATVTPQLCALLEIDSDFESSFAALNSSAIGLGSALGSALGGIALAAGLDAQFLPYASALLLSFTFALQIYLQKSSSERTPSCHVPSSS